MRRAADAEFSKEGENAAASWKGRNAEFNYWKLCKGREMSESVKRFLFTKDREQKSSFISVNYILQRSSILCLHPSPTKTPGCCNRP